MEAASYAVVLRDRIGHDGYDALQEMIRASQENLLTVHHFERRLAEEFGALRVALAQSEAALRLEIREGDAAVRQEVLASRFEVLKWSFVFWVGQAFTVAAIVGVMLQLTRP